MKHHSKTPSQHFGVTALLLALAASAHAGPRASSSSHYTVPADTVDAGGQRASGGPFTNDGSVGGISGISTVASPVQTAKAGYLGQLTEVTALRLAATGTTVNETATLQLSAEQLLDDDSLNALAATDVTWSVQGGPLSGIDSNGLATANVVYEDTAAIAQGDYAGATGQLALTVLESISDNFGNYPGDGLADDWQVNHFGISGDAGPSSNPDGDTLVNLLEFAFGTDPNVIDNSLLTVSGGTFTPGTPTTTAGTATTISSYKAQFVRRTDHVQAGLTYHAQFSSDLITWEDSMETPTFVAGPVSGYEVVKVPYTIFLSTGKKGRFFRITVNTIEGPSTPAP
jgi:hypothetical protein